MDIINILICVLEVALFFDFYDAFMEHRKIVDSRVKKILVVVIFALIIWAVNLIDSTIVNFFGIPVIYLVMCVLCFEGGIYKTLLYAFIGVLVLFGVEFGFAIILSITSQDVLESSMADEASMLLITIIMKLITLLIFVLIKQFAVKSTSKISKDVFGYYIIIPVSSLGLMAAVMYCGIDFKTMNVSKVLLFVFLILLCSGNLLTFYGFNRHSLLITQKIENEKRLLIQELQLDGYEKLEKTKKKHAQLLHDFKHYIMAITELVRNNKLKEAEELLVEFGECYNNIETEEYGSNPIINAILSDYSIKAKENNIRFKVVIEPCFSVEYIKKIDLVSMLGNLLSNAFGAAKKSEDGFIKVEMFMRNEGLFSVIKIENSFDGVITQEEGIIKTSKNYKENHGYGIRNVSETAEKYNGYIQNSWDEEHFKAMLILQNSITI